MLFSRQIWLENNIRPQTWFYFTILLTNSGLKNDYRVFLDSEAKFKIHNLKEIVKHTDNFVFVLTHGILLSHWCLQELLSALENNKKVCDQWKFGFFGSTTPPTPKDPNHNHTTEGTIKLGLLFLFDHKK